MILKNATIYSDGSLFDGSILIVGGKIEGIKKFPTKEDYNDLVSKNEDGMQIECEKKLILPGIIDIHSHLRDLGQSEKETFLTSTRAAAVSGITTVFDMPNTSPPAITAEQVKKWMDKASGNIYVNVRFIAGVPKNIDEEEIKKIVDLGVVGFKIYPQSPLNGINWIAEENIQKLLMISSKFQVPIFIHPDWPMTQEEKDDIYNSCVHNCYSTLHTHDKIYSTKRETMYVLFVLQNYLNLIRKDKLKPDEYPIVHFCHVSCKESYDLIKKNLVSMDKLKVTFEITPHHLLLSNQINLDNDNYGKVLPPLRSKEDSEFLLNELINGRVPLIGTDHAPHTLEEKAKDYMNAPSGFPGFETYPLLLLEKVMNKEIPLSIFVQASSENAAKTFNLENKGFIKEGYDADLLIVSNAEYYLINPSAFKTKAKFSPYKDMKTSICIWKVFLRGIEIKTENINPTGRIL